MKTIGLLGGTSWPSTIEYYRILNVLTQEKLGGFHSANLLLYSNVEKHLSLLQWIKGHNCVLDTDWGFAGAQPPPVSTTL